MTSAGTDTTASPETRRLGLHVGQRYLYALVLTIVFGGVLATAVQSYREIERELTSVALSRRAAVSQLAAATLAEKFNRLGDVALSLATRVKFRELAAAGDLVGASDLLHDVPRDFPFIERIFLTDPDGVLMADVPALPGVRGVSFSHRDWYRGVRRDWRPFLSAVYKRSAKPQIPVFAMAVPIKTAGGAVSGILVLQMRPPEFLEWLRGIVFEADEYVYAVDPKGQVVFHSGFASRGELRDFAALPVVRNVLKGELGVAVGPDPIHREASVAAYAPVAGYGWGIVAQQSARVAFAERDQQLRRVSLAYGLTLLLFAAAMYLITRIVLQRRRAGDDLRMKGRLERLVRERTQQLEAANKELESFSYSISHDLRAPLRAVQGFCRMLKEDYAHNLDEEGRRLLAVIDDSSVRMSQLIEDLLAFSRFGRKPLALALVDMTALVEEVLQELRALPDTVVPARIIDPLPPAAADRALLRQVWMNLLMNAVKFTRGRKAPLIEVSGWTDKEEIVYRVRDNGVGFDMKYYDRLFRVFQRLHGGDEFPGTGVGLAIVQRIMARHGGRVWAEARINDGADFYIALPRAPA